MKRVRPIGLENEFQRISPNVLVKGLNEVDIDRSASNHYNAIEMIVFATH